MGREVKVDLTLILVSKEAEDAYARYSDDGLLSEYISDLFNERASGIAASEFESLRNSVASSGQTIEMLNNTIGSLQRTIEAMLSAGVGNYSPTPAIRIDKDEDLISAPVVKKVSVDPKNMKKDQLAILKKMSKSRGKK
jgi:hypothetical protein